MSIYVDGSQAVYTTTSGDSGVIYNVTSDKLVATEVGSVTGYSNAAQAIITVTGGASDYQFMCSEAGDTQANSNVYIGGETTIEGVTDNTFVVCPV